MIHIVKLSEGVYLKAYPAVTTGFLHKAQIFKTLNGAKEAASRVGGYLHYPIYYSYFAMAVVLKYQGHLDEDIHIILNKIFLDEEVEHLTTKQLKAYTYFMSHVYKHEWALFHKSKSLLNYFLNGSDAPQFIKLFLDPIREEHAL